MITRACTIIKEWKVLVMEKLIFTTEDGEELEFYIIEETRVNGTNYLLVTDSSDESDDEAEAYILKDTSADGDAEAVYEFVDNEDEFDSVGKIFDELLDDIDLE